MHSNIRTNFETFLLFVCNFIFKCYSFSAPLTILETENNLCLSESLEETVNYICDQNLEVICLAGWTDPSNGCKTPICKFLVDNKSFSASSCVHGSCVRPNVCTCEVGWSGQACDICVELPGCENGHGFCTQPGECHCLPGWEGEICDHCITLPGCQHGSCRVNNQSNPFGCICDEGWTGFFCDCPLCREGCNLDHGYCTNSNTENLGECLCHPGWEGPLCDRCSENPNCPGQDENCRWECEYDCKESYCKQKGYRRKHGHGKKKYFHYEMKLSCIFMNKKRIGTTMSTSTSSTTPAPFSDQLI